MILVILVIGILMVTLGIVLSTVRQPMMRHTLSANFAARKPMTLWWRT